MFHTQIIELRVISHARAPADGDFGCTKDQIHDDFRWNANDYYLKNEQNAFKKPNEIFLLEFAQIWQ